VRYSSIDVLRTFAIFVMVFVHFAENLAGVTPRIAGLGAPTFLFLSGLSYQLWYRGQLARDLSTSLISKITMRRGCFLFGLGFAFNVLVWLPEDTFNWDVLTLIGVGMMTMGVAKDLPPLTTLFFAVCVIAMTPLAQSMADWPAYWTEGYFDPDLTFSDVCLGFLVVGYFPILPWLAYPLLGLVVGDWFFGDNPAETPRGVIRQGRWLGLGGMLLAALLLGWHMLLPSGAAINALIQWTMFPPTIVYMAGTLGFVLFAFCSCCEWLDLPQNAQRLPGLRKFSRTFSRHSLTAYLLHHVVHLWPLWVYGWWHGQEPTFYWRQACSLPVAIGLAALFLALSYLFFRWLDARGYEGVEGWMRWLCD
jgi:uncharacterized membrane protein